MRERRVNWPCWQVDRARFDGRNGHRHRFHDDGLADARIPVQWPLQLNANEQLQSLTEIDNPMPNRTTQTTRRSAFTLMELLLVLAILGVLMAMVVPELLGRQKYANIDATQVSVRGAEQALKMYAVDHLGDFHPPAKVGQRSFSPSPLQIADGAALFGASTTGCLGN